MIKEADKRLVKIVPSERQLRHRQPEYYGFIQKDCGFERDKNRNPSDSGRKGDAGDCIPWGVRRN